MKTYFTILLGHSEIFRVQTFETLFSFVGEFPKVLLEERKNEKTIAHLLSLTFFSLFQDILLWANEVGIRLLNINHVFENCKPFSTILMEKRTPKSKTFSFQRDKLINL